MVTNEINAGTLVWMASEPLALWMKTEDSEGLWELGIVLNKDVKKEGYFYILSGGKITSCHRRLTRMIQRLSSSKPL